MKRREATLESENASAAPRTGARSPTAERSDARSTPVEALHGAVGNQAVQRIRETSDRRAALTVSGPGDGPEREARTVADRVVHTSTDDLSIGRAATTRDRPEAAKGGRAADGTADQRVAGLNGGGEQLPPSARSFFERRFDHDFGDVRVHTDARADEAARRMHARAFTVGSDIAFRSGEYRPETTRGRTLLAHELTHVLQQRADGRRGIDVFRQTAGGSPDTDAEMALPSIERVDIATGGETHPDNCCPLCPVPLGIGIGGRALNGMELQFVLSGHRSEIEYDITRRRWSSIWERRDRSWSMVEHVPGKRDDSSEDDECLTPEGQEFAEDRLFVIDSPGFDVSLPRRSGKAFQGYQAAPHADASDIVLRFNFEEAVLGGERDATEKLSMPVPRVRWHSTTWLTRNESGQLVLDRSKSEIGLGHTSGIDSEPSP